MRLDLKGEESKPEGRELCLRMWALSLSRAEKPRRRLRAVERYWEVMEFLEGMDWAEKEWDGSVA
jgi:hypothetical protein